ncbi:type II toxin-antitoxin system PemK/MazF family toxin [Brachybacterium sacelli]|uniref:mRNA-degrading endonuclease toxin of MazEF toxin-antitoxin module n=1 Tax=Brachybacterium sacelli TaxID=173364 RepID=A0ABS4X8Y6_9MICO|nr:type II toxin-antitoxin system PemK/MazF family toxin [Brachybacterium sacelli]MBP2384159.1 mRNA-degrading endonuclease toxin of MazEF toxin-antitoxin module [Brachybacterium sacelli]
MSLLTRLTSVLRTASRSPAVRRGARDLARTAVRAARRPSTDGAGDAALAEAAGALRDREPSRPPEIAYAPHEDDRPDPGEVVWAFVPYEEDITRGKDRPVLVLAREDASTGGSDGSGEVLVALMLTSRDRAASGEVTTDEHGSTWVDIGAGDSDRQSRPSEVRADRLLRLDPDAVRREGGRLDEQRFTRVAEAVRRVHDRRD